MSKAAYIKERDKLIDERTQAIHRAHKDNRHNSPETKMACQDAWDEYFCRIRALRIKYGQPVEGMTNEPK